MGTYNETISPKGARARLKHAISIIFYLAINIYLDILKDTY
jgi:hypothetical protein